MFLSYAVLYFSNILSEFDQYKPVYGNESNIYFFKGTKPGDILKPVDLDPLLDEVNYFPKCCHPSFSYEIDKRECLKLNSSTSNVYDELNVNVHLIKTGLTYCEVIADTYVRKGNLNIMKNNTTLLKVNEEYIGKLDFCLDNIVDNNEDYVIRFCEERQYCLAKEDIWCVPKCCPDGFGLIDGDCVSTQSHGLQVKNNKKLSEINGEYAFLYNAMECSWDMHDLHDLNFTIKNNGSLFLTDNRGNRKYEIDEYCLDTFSYTNSASRKEVILLCDFGDTNLNEVISTEESTLITRLMKSEYDFLSESTTVQMEITSLNYFPLNTKKSTSKTKVTEMPTLQPIQGEKMETGQTSKEARDAMLDISTPMIESIIPKSKQISVTNEQLTSETTNKPLHEIILGNTSKPQIKFPPDFSSNKTDFETESLTKMSEKLSIHSLLPKTTTKWTPRSILTESSSKPTSRNNIFTIELRSDNTTQSELKLTTIDNSYATLQPLLDLETQEMIHSPEELNETTSEKLVKLPTESPIRMILNSSSLPMSTSSTDINMFPAETTSTFAMGSAGEMTTFNEKYIASQPTSVLTESTSKPTSKINIFTLELRSDNTTQSELKLTTNDNSYTTLQPLLDLETQEMIHSPEELNETTSEKLVKLPTESPIRMILNSSSLPMSTSSTEINTFTPERTSIFAMGSAGEMTTFNEKYIASQPTSVLTESTSKLTSKINIFTLELRSDNTTQSELKLTTNDNSYTTLQPLFDLETQEMIHSPEELNETTSEKLIKLPTESPIRMILNSASLPMSTFSTEINTFTPETTSTFAMGSAGEITTFNEKYIASQPTSVMTESTSKLTSKVGIFTLELRSDNVTESEPKLTTNDNSYTTLQPLSDLETQEVILSSEGLNETASEKLIKLPTESLSRMILNSSSVPMSTSSTEINTLRPETTSNFAMGSAGEMITFNESYIISQPTSPTSVLTESISKLTTKLNIFTLESRSENVTESESKLTTNYNSYTTLQPLSDLETQDIIHSSEGPDETTPEKLIEVSTDSSPRMISNSLSLPMPIFSTEINILKPEATNFAIESAGEMTTFKESYSQSQPSLVSNDMNVTTYTSLDKLESTTNIIATATPSLISSMLSIPVEMIVFVNLLCYIIAITIHIFVYKLAKVTERLVCSLCFVDLLFASVYAARIFLNFGKFNNIMGYVDSFLLISRVTWLNVLIYKIRNIIGNKGTTDYLSGGRFQRKSMVYYIIYAFIIPIITTVNLAMGVEGIYSLPEYYRPRMDERGIINGRDNYGYIYLYLPIAILNVINVGIFIVIVHNFAVIKIGNYKKKNELILKILKAGSLIIITFVICFCEYTRSTNGNINMYFGEEVYIFFEGLIFVIMFSIRPRRIYERVIKKRR